jgi:hypothetical protein
MRPYATQEEEFLDSLARWLTYPEDVCVAVCYDKKLKQLLIASNAKKAKCAEASFFLDISQYFTKELSCVQIYEKLRKEAIEKVYHQLYGKAAKSQANKVKGEKEEYD